MAACFFHLTDQGVGCSAGHTDCSALLCSTQLFRRSNSFCLDVLPSLGGVHIHVFKTGTSMFQSLGKGKMKRGSKHCPHKNVIWKLYPLLPFISCWLKLQGYTKFPGRPGNVVAGWIVMCPSQLQWLLVGEQTLGTVSLCHRTGCGL